MKSIQKIIKINDKIIKKIPNIILRDYKQVLKKLPVRKYKYNDKELDSYSSDKQDIYIIILK